MASVTIPPAPADGDWSWTQGSDDPQTAEASCSIALPDGAIGWEILFALNAVPDTFWNQDSACPFDVTSSIAPVTNGDDVRAKMRWIVSGAGFGDPDSVYSEFSAEKLFVYTV